MQKKIYLIAAVSDNGVIGIENRLPWRLPVDLKKFKELTTGNTVIMGRSTFESLGEKPLPNRENIVLTHAPEEGREGPNLKFSGSLEEAIDSSTRDKIFIMGGESVYRQALSDLEISGIYLTKIHEIIPGDKHFPDIPKYFKQVSSESPPGHPAIEFTYFEKNVP